MVNFLTEYLLYLRDNPKRYWFKRKVFGWGWVPATWQGYLVLIVYIILFLFIFIPFMEIATPTSMQIVWFFAKIFTWIGTLIGICYSFGESPKWQWGLRAEEKSL